jgi:hypothetical protein
MVCLIQLHDINPSIQHIHLALKSLQVSDIHSSRTLLDAPLDTLLGQLFDLLLVYKLLINHVVEDKSFLLWYVSINDTA